MTVYCTLTNDMYRYSYGNFNPWQVPFVPGEDVSGGASSRKEGSLCCGRNDWAAAQLLIYCEEDTMICLDGTPGLYEAGPVPALRVEVVFPDCPELTVSVSLVELVQDDDGNYKSEVLLRTRQKYQEKRKVQPVWIELGTGEDAVPGCYEGEVCVYRSSVFGDEEQAAGLPFRLEILPVRVPSLWEGGFRLDLWQHHTSIARTYEVALWSEAHFALMDQALGTLEELGQKSITVIVSDAPWSGQWSAYYRTNPSNCFEYNMVGVTRKKDGTWKYDFSVMNRYIRLCLAHHISGEIEIFGLLGIWTMEDAGFGRALEDGDDAIRIRYYDEAGKVWRYMRRQEEADAYIRAIDQNLCENGWQDMARIACDEPGDSGSFGKIIRRMKELMPHIRMKVTFCKMDVLQEDYPEISDYVINLPLILEDKDRIAGLREKKDVTVSYYTAIEPAHPNSFLNCHPAEIRFLPWLSGLLGMDGFLRWAVWLWPNEPFSYESYHYQKFRSGGTHFLYPGKDGVPLYSIRYKQLKRGIRDMLILSAYEEKTGDKDRVRQAMERIMKVAAPEGMRACFRREAGEIISLDWKDYEEISNGFLKMLVWEDKG